MQVCRGDSFGGTYSRAKPRPVADIRHTALGLPHLRVDNHLLPPTSRACEDQRGSAWTKETLGQRIIPIRHRFKAAPTCEPVNQTPIDLTSTMTIA